MKYIDKAPQRLQCCHGNSSLPSISNTVSIIDGGQFKWLTIMYILVFSRYNTCDNLGTVCLQLCNTLFPEMISYGFRLTGAIHITTDIKERRKKEGRHYG